MAMNFGPSADDEVVSSINTTPLVDVMLVLLIIFLITIPVVNTAVSVRLPQERSTVREARPEQIVLSVHADGSVHGADGRAITSEHLPQYLTEISSKQPQPELHILGDQAATWAQVAPVMRAAKAAGVARLAFVTDPSARPWP